MERSRRVDDQRRPGAVAQEGGKGTVPIAFHFQFRPNPLAD
jgi:hypothetical protein